MNRWLNSTEAEAPPVQDTSGSPTNKSDGIRNYTIDEGISIYLVYPKSDQRPTNDDMDALMLEEQQTNFIGDPYSKSRAINSRRFNTNGRRLERYIDSKMDTFAFGSVEHTCHLSNVIDISITLLPMEIYTVIGTQSDSPSNGKRRG